MKKLLVTIIFILSFVGSAVSEILKFDCNYYSSKKVDSLKTNLRIIDTENKTFEIFLEGNNNKVEKYTFNIEKLIDPTSRYHFKSIGLFCVFQASIDMANALITENKVIPDNSLVVGSPGKIVRQVSTEEVKLITENAIHYQDNWKKYSKSVF